jgi:hypothetical protein
MHIMRANYFATVAVLLFGSLFGRQIRSEEALNIEAQQYLEENSDRNADARWENNSHRRADKAMRENQSISDEERYANDKVLEYFFDKKKHFDQSSVNPLSVKDKIETARWYLLFFKNGWHFPARIASLLTKTIMSDTLHRSNERFDMLLDTGNDIDRYGCSEWARHTRWADFFTSCWSWQSL